MTESADSRPTPSSVNSHPLPGGSGRPTVAVIGGGYAGTAVAKGLDDVADVVLVEPKEAFFHNVAALRALVAPEWLPRILLPYDDLLANGRVVRDRAARVEPHRVTLASGEELAADYIVLATGSSYPFPAKLDSDDTAEIHERHASAHAGLAEADRVLLLGAGPVGIELAGEIKAVWPAKDVILVDQADDILAGPFDPRLRVELRRQLAELGVELLLGSKLRGEPAPPPGVNEPFTVVTEAGVELSADLWFRTYGVVPITDYLSDELAAARTAAGDLEVTPELRLAGQDSVFALGDVANADRKMAGALRTQVPVVVGNITALIEGEGELATHEQAPTAIAVPLGPEGGAGQMPGADEISGPEEIAAIKGRDMIIGPYAEVLGVKEPAAH
jgi:NADH dehydrogenase FAD-containing subunit